MDSTKGCALISSHKCMDRIPIKSALECKQLSLTVVYVLSRNGAWHATVCMIYVIIKPQTPLETTLGDALFDGGMPLRLR